MPDLLSLSGLLLIVAALVVGISKTSVSGFGSFAVAAFALVMPAKESTAAVLLLLIIGDIVAVLRYRKHCNWALLRRLLPSVLPGVALGAWVLSVISDVVLKRGIGVLLVIFTLYTLWSRLSASRREAPPAAAGEVRQPHWAMAVGAGVAAGFTTMTANSAGPDMTLYLLEAGVTKSAFVGTGAWFFFLVNLSKTPFSAALGLFPPSTLLLTACLAPVVLLGTWIGVKVVRKLSQRAFENLALAASALAALMLIVR